MQRTIWKFPISGRDFEVSGLIEPYVIHVGEDPVTQLPAVWISHVTDDDGLGYKPMDLRFEIVGTGWDYTSSGKFDVGSVVMSSGFVWHILQHGADRYDD